VFLNFSWAMLIDVIIVELSRAAFVYLVTLSWNVNFETPLFIAACFSAKDFSYNVNPFALGSRWLAYADKKVSKFLT
jgi:hypothetical protein